MECLVKLNYMIKILVYEKIIWKSLLLRFYK